MTLDKFIADQITLTQDLIKQNEIKRSLLITVFFKDNKK